MCFCFTLMFCLVVFDSLSCMCESLFWTENLMPRESVPPGNTAQPRRSPPPAAEAQRALSSASEPPVISRSRCLHEHSARRRCRRGALSAVGRVCRRHRRNRLSMAQRQATGATPRPRAGAPEGADGRRSPDHGDDGATPPQIYPRVAPPTGA